MGKVNVLLFLLVVYSAMLVVESQHHARTVFVQLGVAQVAERQLEVDFNRLQLEQVALSKGDRIDRIARETLQMKVPSANNTVFMTLDGRLLDE